MSSKVLKVLARYIEALVADAVHRGNPSSGGNSWLSLEHLSHRAAGSQSHFGREDAARPWQADFVSLALVGEAEAVATLFPAEARVATFDHGCHVSLQLTRRMPQPASCIARRGTESLSRIIAKEFV